MNHFFLCPVVCRGISVEYNYVGPDVIRELAVSEDRHCRMLWPEMSLSFVTFWAVWESC